MELCGFIDLGFEGYPFTWSNGRKGEDNIQCCLDRALATNQFVNKFSPIKVLHLSCFGSDHAALRIDLEAEDTENRKKKIHVFQFEEIWTKDHKCEELVGQLWAKSGNNTEQKLKAMQEMDFSFKEYRLNLLGKEIKRIAREGS